MNNPATELIAEIILANKLHNRTKNILGPESEEDFEMYKESNDALCEGVVQ